MKYYMTYLKMVSPELSQKHRQEHLDYLARLEQEGKVFAKGRFVDGTGGMVIYMADNQEQVEAWVSQDPYIVHQARTPEIHEWEMTTVAVIPPQ